MEWKHDEQWCYRMSQEVGRVRPWPAVGMPTSLGIPNPGLSVWALVPIGRIATSPTSIARAVGVLNVISLIGFAAAVCAYLPSSEREPWLWGLAFEAVSPFPIRMSRKIWPPSILTPLLALLWVSQRHRQKRWGALMWGLVGALIGQVHLSGWFEAAGLAIGTAGAELRGTLRRSRYWHLWLCGSVVGLIPALPWARALPGLPLSIPTSSFDGTIMNRFFACIYKLFAAATGTLGCSDLGLGLDTPRYEIGPFIGGIPAHVPDTLSWLIAVPIAIAIVARLYTNAFAPALRRVAHLIATRTGRRPRVDAPAKPPHTRERVPSTRFYLWSTIAIPCALFALMTDVYFYHYFLLCARSFSFW
jgi:hypothetical protein